MAGQRFYTEIYKCTSNVALGLKSQQPFTLRHSGDDAEEICLGQVMRDIRTKRPTDGWRGVFINVGRPKSRTLIFLNCYLFQIIHFSLSRHIVYALRQYLSARRSFFSKNSTLFSILSKPKKNSF